MYSKAETAFKAANVVLEEVWVFVQVDRFQGKFAETFATVSVGRRGGRDTSSAEFGTCTILIKLANRR